MFMKKMMIPFLLILLGCKESGQDTFTVDGSIKNGGAQIVYLEETAMNGSNPVIVDSAKLDKSGKFELSTLSKGETIFNLRLAGQTYPLVSLINDAEKVTVTVDPTSKEVYTIKGSEASEALRSYLFTSGEQLRGLYNSSRAVDSMQQAGVSDSVVNLQLAKRSVDATAIKNYTADFIAKSNSPSLTLFALGSYQSMASNPAFGIEGFSGAEAKSMVQKAAAKSPDHQGLAQVAKSLEQPAAAAQQGAAPAALLNKPAPDFTLPDLTGKPVALSSFKGKWVLVDFWASWCPPCRAENPNVVKAFNQFKAKNFTILGVSLDRPGQKDKWEEAIKADGLAWNHVSDLKFWESAVVPLYNIEGIPYNVLINPEGVVVAENLRGEDLAKKLAEVL
jgi:peroxiredoxin